jgi:hypothetical protein
MDKYVVVKRPNGFYVPRSYNSDKELTALRGSRIEILVDNLPLEEAKDFCANHNFD